MDLRFLLELHMLPQWTSRSYNFDKAIWKLIWKCSLWLHELLPQSYHWLHGQIPCSLVYYSVPNFQKSSLHLQKQRRKKRVATGRRWQLVRRDGSMWKDSTKRRSKKPGCKGESRDTGGTSKGRKLHIQLYQEEWDFKDFAQFWPMLWRQSDERSKFATCSEKR